MGEKYIKDGKLYERDVFGDVEIGEIKSGFLGDWVDTKCIIDSPFSVDQNLLTGKTEVTTHRDYLSNAERGFTIEEKPLGGQESHDWEREIIPTDTHTPEPDEETSSDTGNNQVEENASPETRESHKEEKICDDPASDEEAEEGYAPKNSSERSRINQADLSEHTHKRKSRVDRFKVAEESEVSAQHTRESSAFSASSSIPSYYPGTSSGFSRGFWLGTGITILIVFALAAAVVDTPRNKLTRQHYPPAMPLAGTEAKGTAPHVRTPSPPRQPLTPTLQRKVRAAPSKLGVGVLHESTPPGVYTTIRATIAHSAPSDFAPGVARIAAGTTLHVRGSNGDWLIVYSYKRNIMAFVRRNDARLFPNQRTKVAGTAEDQWGKIEVKISDALLNWGVANIRVNFIDNTAYLKGKVKTERERFRAQMAAHSIPEVKHIVNWIQVEQ